MCKKFKFGHASKSYMHNPEFVQENETHKIQFQPEVKKKKKRTYYQVDFTVQQSWNGRKQKDWRIPRSYRRAEISVKHKCDGNNNCTWCSWNDPQRPEGNWGTEKQR